MAKKIRVGIIGCGMIADVTHVPGYLSAKGSKIVSLLDVVSSRARKLREKFKLEDAQCFKDYDKFMASDLDAVSVCTPNHLHYPQTMAVLKAGVHVLCEKPMAATLPECTSMIAAAKKAKKILQINQTLRYLELYQAMADIVASGKIGDPVHCRCIRGHGSTPDKGWSPGAKWFVQKKCQGGIVLDIGVHMADFMKWVVGDVTEVAAYVDTRIKTIDVPDNVSAIMRFANGATGVLELSWTIPTGAAVFEVYGTKGTLRQGFTDGDKPLQLITAATKSKRASTTYPKPKKRVKNSHQCFIEAINGKAASPTPGQLGRDAIALCNAILTSGKTRKFAKVKRFK
jgi:predicted dehydrogenase